MDQKQPSQDNVAKDDSHQFALLPRIFRHKTTKIRVFQPQVVLLDLHGTLCERRFEDRVVFPYVRRAVTAYLKDNLANDTVQKCIPGLRNESFEQRFRHKYEDAPVVDDAQPGADQTEDVNPAALAAQLGEFLQWQMNTKRETKETQIITRLVWIDGFKRKQIVLPLYDDVAPALKQWHGQYKCHIYVISSLEEDTLRLLLESTDQGDMNSYLSGVISAKKLISETYKQFHDKVVAQHGLTLANTSISAPGSPGPGSSPSLPSLRAMHSHVSDGPPRPILFITDSGQEAKAANQAVPIDQGGYECVLVSRPSNKRIRAHYLTQFPYVEKLSEIEFVSWQDR